MVPLGRRWPTNKSCVFRHTAVIWRPETAAGVASAAGRSSPRLVHCGPCSSPLCGSARFRADELPHSLQRISDRCRLRLSRALRAFSCGHTSASSASSWHTVSSRSFLSLRVVSGDPRSSCTLHSRRTFDLFSQGARRFSRADFAVLRNAACANMARGSGDFSDASLAPCEIIVCDRFLATKAGRLAGPSD